MPNPKLFSLFEGFIQGLSLPAPPAWLVEEGQRRVVLLLNHLLMQEPQAMQRLRRQSGRVLLAQWRSWHFALLVTPAGLLDLAAADAAADLRLVLTEASPIALAQGLARGDKPALRIEGDVQLAAEVNWLADNLRWDLEEDLSRVIGDAPAHMLVQAARTAAGALRDLLGRAGALGSSAGSAA